MAMDTGMFWAHSGTSNSGLPATLSSSCGEMPYLRANLSRTPAVVLRSTAMSIPGHSPRAGHAGR